MMKIYHLLTLWFICIYLTASSCFAMDKFSVEHDIPSPAIRQKVLDIKHVISTMREHDRLVHGVTMIIGTENPQPLDFFFEKIYCTSVYDLQIYISDTRYIDADKKKNIPICLTNEKNKFFLATSFSHSIDTIIFDSFHFSCPFSTVYHLESLVSMFKSFGG